MSNLPLSIALLAAGVTGLLKIPTNSTSVVLSGAGSQTVKTSTVSMMTDGRVVMTLSADGKVITCFDDEKEPPNPTFMSAQYIFLYVAICRPVEVKIVHRPLP